MRFGYGHGHQFFIDVQTEQTVVEISFQRRARDFSGLRRISSDSIANQMKCEPASRLTLANCTYEYTMTELSLSETLER